MMPESQNRRRRKLSYKKLRGMTLVELMVTVSIAGVLATAATASFREQVNKSHSVEAVSMLGTMRKAISVAGLDAGNVDSDLNFTRTTFGKGNGKSNGNSNKNSSGDSGGVVDTKSGMENDVELKSSSNNGHGNNEGGCDPSNPNASKKGCDGSPSESDSSSGSDSSSDSGKSNNGNGSNKDGGLDGDGNNGHGNNADGCDPDNPGKGGPQCDGGDGDGDGASSGGDGDGASSGGDGDGDGASSGGDGDGASGGDGDGDGASPDDDGSDSGSDDSGGGSGSGSNGIERLCGSASPVPASIDNVRGKVFNAPPSAWSSGSSSAGWSCLRVSRSGNQRYQFGYDKGAGTTPGADEGFTAWARGDLDGDGRNSLFRVRGDLVNGKIIHGAGVEMIDETE